MQDAHVCTDEHDHNPRAYERLHRHRHPPSGIDTDTDTDTDRSAALAIPGIFRNGIAKARQAI